VHVCYWPKADIASCIAHVRFRGESGHGRQIRLALALLALKEKRLVLATLLACLPALVKWMDLVAFIIAIMIYGALLPDMKAKCRCQRYPVGVFTVDVASVDQVDVEFVDRTPA
jgi:hypothetical protein